MILHILPASFYIEEFVLFMQDHLDSFTIQEHKFILFSKYSDTKTKPIYLKTGLNITRNHGVGLMVNFFKTGRNDTIILHSLSNSYLLFLLFFMPWITGKCTWVLWGSDLYMFQKKDKSLKQKIIEAIRRIVLPKIPFVTCVLREDFEVFQSTYHSKAKYIHSQYRVPGFGQLLYKEFQFHNFKNVATILLGNSADPSNCHIEAINHISHLRDKNVRIIIPLSYGGSKKYALEVEEYGRKIFGDKLQVLSHAIPKEQYYRLLDEINVLVFNHKRQQGLSNIYYCILAGKKIFLRSEISSYQFFNRLGIKVYDENDLPSMDYNDIFAYDEEIAYNNSRIMRQINEENHLASGWNNVFNKIPEND